MREMFAIWALDKEVLVSISGRTNLTNELFQIGFGYSVRE